MQSAGAQSEADQSTTALAAQRGTATLRESVRGSEIPPESQLTRARSTRRRKDVGRRDFAAVYVIHNHLPRKGTSSTRGFAEVGVVQDVGERGRQLHGA